MKKVNIFLSTVAFSMMIVSCSSVKEMGTSENLLNGTWQLRTISTEGVQEKIKTQILSEADFNCFVGSLWNFNKKTNRGYYRISKNGNECAAVRRNINWSIAKDAAGSEILQYKRADADFKEFADGGDAVRFNVLSLEKNSMQLKNEMTIEGKPATLTFNFIRY